MIIIIKDSSYYSKYTSGNFQLSIWQLMFLIGYLISII